jgi:uncharacterized membrane protein YdcZ (DUF606 family)
MTTASSAQLPNITIILRAIPWWDYFGGVVATTMIKRLTSALRIMRLRLQQCAARPMSGVARSVVLGGAALSVSFGLGMQLTLTQEIALLCALPRSFIVCRLQTLDDLRTVSNDAKQAPRHCWLMGA